MDTCNACNVNAILLQMYVENQVHANKQNSGFFISSQIFELGVIQTVFFFWCEKMLLELNSLDH